MRPVAGTGLSCILYDGVTPLGQASVLLWDGSDVHVTTAEATVSYAAASLRASSRSVGADRFISLPDGGQLQCPDFDRLDLLSADDPFEQLGQWFDRRWGVALACLGLLAAGLWLGYQRGLSAVAERIADRVPLEYERRLGDSALQWLDLQQLLRPTTVKQPARGILQDGFARLTLLLPRAYAARLDLRNAPVLGPNALALPGGIIVMTDQMFTLCKSPDEALVVLAHEIGHVERKHAMRMALESSAAAALASSFAADFSWLGLTLTGLPSQLLAARYSRALEAEADEFAFQLAAQRGLQVEAFAVVMERMQKAVHGAKSSPGFLDSHPATAERIARARGLSALDGAQLAAPKWSVGDRWSYVALEPEDDAPAADAKGEGGRGAPGLIRPTDRGVSGETLQWTVSREEQIRGVDHYVLASDDNERSQFVRRDDLALAVELDADEVALRYDPPQQPYSWPMARQSSWSTAWAQSKAGQRRPQRVELSCRVDAAGLTSVPAGSFHAMKIVCTDAKTQQLVSERWYAPVVRQWIIERRYADGKLVSTWALADYRLH